MSITTLVVCADSHINSTVGLCTPVVDLDDGTYHASRSQRWLYECWIDFCKRAGEAPGRKIAILNGDLGELDVKRRSYQLITPNKATILKMVIDTLEPLLSVVDAVYILRGTAAHTGKSAWLEEAVANDIETVVHHNGTASWWHYRGKCEDVRLDVAHHASMSGLPWTLKNSALRMAAKTVFQYAESYQQPAPHLVIRSHNHKTADSYNNYSSRAIFTPAFCLPTEYAYRAGHENDLADIGGMLITCENGVYDYKDPILYRPKESKRLWSMTM